MNNEHQGYIPKTLDNLARFGFWDIYQSMLFLLVFGFGIVMHFLLSGLILGALLAWGYGRMSSGRTRGFLIHLLYWFTPLGSGYKSLPPSDKRHFIG
ncbi:hypothetical protein JCM30760_26000 [Thiomicrorhabdus hydrogeniphila]